MNKFYTSATGPMPIAIIGMGMRFPANVRTEAEMWKTLAGAQSSITEIPAERWPVADLSHPERGEPGRSVNFRAGVLKGVDEFDAAFFGISPREAAWMDPQQRILLEMAHDAMEDAGIPPQSLAGSSCGVFVGISGMDYGQNALEDLASMSPWTMTGNTLSIAANRLSWVYDLQGPSLAIDTACSSSLAALHQACQALRNGEIPLSLAGGVNVLMHPYAFIGFSLATMLSAKGECRPFDSRASGYVRGEGGALFLLKPLEKALADKDRIHAVILGTGINSDGARKSGLTIPSADAQTELMRTVLAESGLEPDNVDFVEAHGTGTPVGDPVEAKSIGQAYGSRRVNPLPISSAKANFGHLEPASGMAGMVKAILAMKHGKIPPMPLDYAPNPAIPFEELNIFCAAAGHELKRPDGRPLTCAVNSFGFGGLNAHALLASAPAEAPAPKEAGFPPLFLSARTDKALRELAGSYASYLKENNGASFADIAASTALSRDFLEKRLAVSGDSLTDNIAALQALAAGDTPAIATLASALPEEGFTAFIYSGNGSQWAGMGRQLLQESEEFNAAIDEIDAAFKPVCGWSVKDALYEGSPDFLADTANAQPMLFALQAALTLVLKALGIRPQATAGHSVGEIAAAWAAGQLSLAEAIQIVHVRSVAQGHTRGTGKMAAVGFGANEAARIIAEEHLDHQLEIAAANSPRNSTVSGDEEALDKLGEILNKQGIFFRKLELDYAFHSRAMDKEAGELARMLEGLAPKDSPDIMFVSTVNAKALQGSSLGPDYWWENMRKSVNFTDAINTLYEAGARVFVEIGPHAVLQRYIRENLADSPEEYRILPLLQRENAGFDRIRRIADNLHLLGGLESIRHFFEKPASRLPLPLYPWQKEKHTFPRTSERQPRPERRWPLLGWRLPGPDPIWENILDPRKDLWLEDHKIGDTTVLAAAAWLEIALEAGQAWLESPATGIENLTINLPLVFENSRPQTMRASINPMDGTFRILSRPRLDNGEWIEHAKGRILALSAPPAPALPPLVNGEKLTREDLYSLTRHLGLEYGPFFRRIENLHFKDNEISAELEDIKNDNFVLDPGAIDACFHSLVSLYGKNEAAFLPVGASRVSVYSIKQPRSLRGILKKVSRRTLQANFLLLDETGEPIADLKGCLFRKLPASTHTETVAKWESMAEFAPLPKNTAPENLDRPVSFENERGFSEERKFWHQETLQNLEAMAAAGSIFFLKQFQGQAAKVLPAPLIQWINTLAGENSLEEVKDLPDWRDIWNDLRKLAPQWLPVFLPTARFLDRLCQISDKDPTINPVFSELEESADSLVHTATNPIWHGAEQIISGLLQNVRRSMPEDCALHIEDYGPWPSLSGEESEKDKSPGRIVWHKASKLPDNGDQSAEIVAPDIILARNILYKAENLVSGLARLHERLQPGGILLIEERHPDWSAVLLEGLEESSWRKTADDTPSPARMWPEDWRKTLEAAGFENIEIILEPEARGLPQGAFVIKASKSRKHAENRQNIPAASWLIVADKETDELATSLACELERNGQRVVTSPSDDIETDNTVFIANPDTEQLPSFLDKLGKRLSAISSGHAWLVTRGGALLSDLPCDYERKPLQGAITGFARVFNSESSGIFLNSVDVDPSFNADKAARLLTEEFLTPASHEEAVWTEKGRYAPRIRPHAATVMTVPERCQLDVPQPGKIDNIVWKNLEEAEPGPDELEARVMATGLNFRDIMLSLGLLPEDALENGFAGARPGLEFAGVVTRTGRDVKNFAPGDRIAGFAPASFSSHVRTPADACAKIPAALPFNVAASLPVIFVTAWYALHYLGRIAPGETVLIHGGAGGVGLAAIQIARQAGARIFATAGSPEKRDLLRLLGVDLVADSRSLAFADEIMDATGGKGVDIVLNSLAGEAMRRSLSLLKPFGRFLELGKRDYVENTSIGLAPFKENISYFSIDVDQLLTGRPELAGRLFAEIMDILDKRELLPPPVRVFPADKIVPAFRAMQHSRQIGKLVVAMKKLPQIERPNVLPQITDKTGTWLVTGGLSGFGLATARHLAETGIKNLVLVSRHGQKSPDYPDIKAYFDALGVNLLVEACDVANEEAVARLVGKISQNMPPLHGIVHAAAVFDDRLLKDMDMEAYARVLKPKLQGALNLHKATKNLPVKYFVLYSSISVAIGNPGQANYVAANAGLESLTSQRLAMGLPASCIAWGPIGDCGYLGRNQKVLSILENRMGACAMSAAEAMEQFDLFAAKDGIHIIGNLDWQKIGNANGDVPARFSRLASAGGPLHAHSGGLGEKLRVLPREEALDTLRNCVTDETAKVLGLSTGDIPSNRSLSALGLDSLMAMELATGIEQSTGLRLPPMLMQDAPSIDQLVERLYDRVSGSQTEEAESDAMLAELARKHAESLAPEESRDVLNALKEEKK